MSRVFFSSELEGVATFWRIHRRDGITLGFTTHDRDLVFAGVRHRAAPGLLPSAIRRTAGLDGDSAEMQGALAHDSISSRDLFGGRFDGAQVEVGAVDWETLENAVLYHGQIGEVSQDGAGFSAELRSAKAALEVDPVPRTSPTCRAEFCGPECGLSSAKFTHRATVTGSEPDLSLISFAVTDTPSFLHGTARFIDGPHAGMTCDVVMADADGFVLDAALDPPPAPGTRAILREGCDRTIATCTSRFANAANFRGEPFLPGNDLLTRYPSPA